MPRPVERGGAADALQRATQTSGRSALNLDETIAPSFDLLDLSKSPYSNRGVCVPFNVLLQAASVEDEFSIVSLAAKQGVIEIVRLQMVAASSGFLGSRITRTLHDTLTLVPSQPRSANSASAAVIPVEHRTGSATTLGANILDTWAVLGPGPNDQWTDTIAINEGNALPPNQAFALISSTVLSGVLGAAQCRWWPHLDVTQGD